MAKIYERAVELTAKHQNELSPCAICGNTDIQFWPDKEWWPKWRYVWTINCTTKNCNFVVVHTVKEAIRKWNDQQEECRKNLGNDSKEGE